MGFILAAVFIFAGLMSNNDIWLMMGCFGIASIFAVSGAIDYVGSKIDEFVKAYKERTEELKKK